MGVTYWSSSSWRDHPLLNFPKTSPFHPITCQGHSNTAYWLAQKEANKNFASSFDNICLTISVFPSFLWNCFWEALQNGYMAILLMTHPSVHLFIHITVGVGNTKQVSEISLQLASAFGALLLIHNPHAYSNNLSLFSSLFIFFSSDFNYVIMAVVIANFTLSSQKTQGLF